MSLPCKLWVGSQVPERSPGDASPPPVEDSRAATQHLEGRDLKIKTNRIRRCRIASNINLSQKTANNLWFCHRTGQLKHYWLFRSTLWNTIINLFALIWNISKGFHSLWLTKRNHWNCGYESICHAKRFQNDSLLSPTFHLKQQHSMLWAEAAQVTQSLMYLGY